MSYNNLTYDERECIEFFIKNDLTQTEMAKLLKRSKSTISRELKRNSHSWYGYQAAYAQKKFEGRKCGQQRHPVLDNPDVVKLVQKGFEKDWAPHVISGRAKLEKQRVSISTESIYRLVYRDYCKGGTLWEYLKSFRKRRKHHLGRPDQRGQIAGRVFIDKRPTTIENRTRYGHWEGDTMIGRNHKGVIFTGIERKSRYIIAHSVGSKLAQKVNSAVSYIFRSLPDRLKKTITVDNGQEFAYHRRIAKNTGMNVYFSHPGCPYEKGSIENGNRMIRRSLPKGTDITALSAWELTMIIRRLNSIPRKILNYLTPYEVLFNNRKVALQI
jgi:IS30 family transposase